MAHPNLKAGIPRKKNERFQHFLNGYYYQQSHSLFSVITSIKKKLLTKVLKKLLFLLIKPRAMKYLIQ
jgi:hypothetical protein